MVPQKSLETAVKKSTGYHKTLTKGLDKQEIQMPLGTLGNALNHF